MKPFSFLFIVFADDKSSIEIIVIFKVSFILLRKRRELSPLMSTRESCQAIQKSEVNSRDCNGSVALSCITRKVRAETPRTLGGDRCCALQHCNTSSVEDATLSSCCYWI